MSNTPESTYRPAPSVLSQAVHGEIVLLDLEGAEYFGLNEVGAQVWQLLAAGHSRAAIVEKLLVAYDVAPETLARDVDALLADLLARKLLEPQAPAAAN